MGSKCKKITEKDAKEIVKRCNSIADFCREVGWKPEGSNYKTFHRYEKEYNLDTSHFTNNTYGYVKGGVKKVKSATE